jgi:hypothetical protein
MAFVTAANTRDHDRSKANKGTLRKHARFRTGEDRVQVGSTYPDKQGEIECGTYRLPRCWQSTTFLRGAANITDSTCSSFCTNYADPCICGVEVRGGTKERGGATQTTYGAAAVMLPPSQRTSSFAVKQRTRLTGSSDRPRMRPYRVARGTDKSGAAAVMLRPSEPSRSTTYALVSEAWQSKGYSDGEGGQQAPQADQERVHAGLEDLTKLIRPLPVASQTSVGCSFPWVLSHLHRDGVEPTAKAESSARW